MLIFSPPAVKDTDFTCWTSNWDHSVGFSLPAIALPSPAQLRAVAAAAPSHELHGDELRATNSCTAALLNPIGYLKHIIFINAACWQNNFCSCCHLSSVSEYWWDTFWLKYFCGIKLGFLQACSYYSNIKFQLNSHDMGLLILKSKANQTLRLNEA